MSLSRNLKLVAVLFFGLALAAQAQVNKIKLEQTPGAFAQTSLMLAPGDYQFEIANMGVDHEVGFVLAPKGKTDAANHIKEAYVTAPVKNGSSSMTKVVSLDAGDYVYFCPMNPTEQYSLTVKGDMMEKDGMMKKEKMMDKSHGMMEKDEMMKKDGMKKEKMMDKSHGMTEKDKMMKKEAMMEKEAMMKKIKLVQTKGEFKTKSLMIDAGTYQFEIQNMGVGHDVGFVLAPKGKTDAANHIKEAYVTAPVKDGTTGMTKVVNLTPGEYVYFCPLNPTEEYNLTVK